MTNFEEENEPIVFTNNILGNYYVESFLGNFNAHQSLFLINSITSQIKNFPQSDSSKCVNIVEKPLVKYLFWTLYFDGSRSNDGVGASCILISLEGEKTFLACRLEFECTNNIIEYEELV